MLLSARRLETNSIFLEGVLNLRSFMRSHQTGWSVSETEPFFSRSPTVMPENQLWLNAAEAAKMGVADGDPVRVTSSDGSHAGTIQAFVTEFIHPESVFMVHGFGRKVPWQTRGYNKGLGDYRFETGLLDVYDPVGGANSLMECFVKVEKA